MDKKELLPMPINSLHYFNAHTRADEDVQRTFIVRKHVLNEILTGIGNERPGSIAQHYMVVGSRGMGKSTLLKMLEIELRTGSLKERFIPVLFPEEQYNLDRLSKFWLNCLDALADTFEQEQNETETAALDQLIRALEKNNDENILADQAFDAVIEICKRYNRRPVLLVDNIDILFDGITEDQQFKLRKEITQNGAPIFIGASTRQPDDSQNYDAAFYDAFDNIYLENLSRQELRELLTGLAIATGKEESVRTIYTHQSQLAALHRLSGGNPRVTAFIFQLIANGLSDQIFDNLNLLLDLVTPLYKANFEQMSKQAQVIVDGLALNWDPCDLDTLSNRTRISKDQLASQLNRLIKSGWVERSSRFSTEKLEIAVKNKNYSIRERFFNIWYIMRRASRRQRGELRSLTCFLETFYTGEHLIAEKMRIMDAIKNNPDADKVIYGLALARAHERDAAMNEMEKDIYRRVIETEDGNLKNVNYLDPNEIPEELVYEYFINSKNWKKYLSQLESEKKYEKGISFISEILKVHPDSAYAWGRAGGVYIGLKQLEKAESAFEKAIELDSTDDYFWIRLGILKETQKEFDEARKKYEKAISIKKDSAAWGFLAFLFYYRVNDKLETENVIKRGIQAGIEEYFFWYVVGNFRLDAGKKDEAEDAYKKVLALQPDYPYALLGLAKIFALRQQYEESDQMLDEVLKIDPKINEAWEMKGAINMFDLERKDVAERCYEKLIENDANAFHPRIMLTLIHINEHRLIRARNTIEEALAIQKTDSDAWGLYGRLLMLDFPEEKATAETALETAIELNAQNLVSVSDLVYLLRDKMRNIEKAKMILKEKLLPLADSVMAELQLGTFALYDENWGIAAVHWKQAIKLTGETFSDEAADDWYRSIAIAQKLGYGEKLITLWEQEGAKGLFRPMFEALKALEYGEQDYLFNVAEEVREPATAIYDFMKDYQQTDQ